MKDTVQPKFFHRCLLRYDSEVEALIKAFLHCNRMLLIELPFFFRSTKFCFHVGRQAEIMGQIPLSFPVKPARDDTKSSRPVGLPSTQKTRAS